MIRLRSMGVALLLALAGCASAPQRAPVDSTTNGQRPAANTDEGGLWYATDQVEKQVQASPLRVRDPALNAYVRDVICRLAGAECARLRVYVMDVPAFNATMAPNGMVQVWTGLLLRCEDEAELAFVLGHEIGHFGHKHTLAQWRRLKATEGWTSVVQLITVGAGVGLVGQLATLAGYAGVLAYSRDQERAADAAGFESLQAGGYAADAAADLFEALLAEEQAREKNKPSAIFATHPTTAERIANLRAQARASATSNTDRGRERFLAATTALRMGWLRSELGRRHDAQTLVLLDRLRHRADERALGELDYAKAEVLRRRGRPGDQDLALALYRSASAAAGAPVEVHRDLGLLLRTRGEVENARASLRRYLSLAPEASDRALIEHYLEGSSS